ncbi:MAG: type II secretion system F family protein [Acidimicrobiia bacterium]|nr:type II secretion system F family protein [Acidimicrobiia bacterium]
MPMLVWIAAAMLASSLPMAWWAVSADRQLTRRVSRNLADYQPTMREAVLERSATERFVLPLMRSVGQRLMRFTPIGWIDSKATTLAKAGWTGRISPEQLLGAKLILPLVVGSVLALRLIDNLTIGSLLTTMACMLAAFLIPDLLVQTKADRRAEEITILLPDVLDQITISVEAGLGFEAAIDRLVASEKHALAVEFGRMIQDIRMGTSRANAMERMADRSQVEDLRSVMLNLRQAEMLGVPLARSLRAVSADMREKRRFRAEERANRLPIKMMFPLGLCILPTLFIAILGPAVISLIEIFG